MTRGRITKINDASSMPDVGDTSFGFPVTDRRPGRCFLQDKFAFQD
jgi:hypothetical protein